ncbi:class I SAM-dependent methyltransferase [Mycobacterium koreense]|nr:class I SAM-dependent methyltransferase [Mycolicibacillus koreensis]MCV7246902.1 class I SAM-dependent methyltransferase [Mycolicibacillus koreensis]
MFADILYRSGKAPWDLGAPQPAVAALIAHGAVQGRVLDAGCGTGHHAVALARAGCDVVGIDGSPTAVRRARLNARAAGVEVEFRCGDVVEELCNALHSFDAVLDSKCFDNLPSTADRRRYAAALHHVMKPGGLLYMLNFARGDSVDGVR